MKIKIYIILFLSLFSLDFLLANSEVPFALKTDKQGILSSKNVPDFISIPKSFDEPFEPVTQYYYDSLSSNWKPLPVKYPSLLDMERLKIMSFDPVKFTIHSNKDSISLREEVELTITAEYLDIHGMTMFQFEGSNEFTLKLLMPDGFVMTGGSYYDFIQGKVDKQKPIIKYTIVGFFVSSSQKECFKLLRSKSNAQKEDFYYLVSDKCLSLGQTRLKKDIFPNTAFNNGLSLKEINKHFLSEFENSVTAVGDYSFPVVDISLDCEYLYYDAILKNLTNATKYINKVIYHACGNCPDNSGNDQGNYIAIINQNIESQGEVSFRIKVPLSFWPALCGPQGDFKNHFDIQVGGTYDCQVLGGFSLPTIPVPNAISGENQICTSNLTLSTSGCPDGYNWEGYSETSGTLTTTLTATKTFIVSCKGDLGTCYPSVTKTVVANIVGTPSISTAPISGTIYCGEFITLTSSCPSGGTIKWSTGSTNSSITVNPNVDTDYWAECKSGTCISSRTTVTINVLPASKPMITSSTNSFKICPGNSVTLNSGCSVGSLLWSTGSTANSITVSPSQDTDYTATCVGVNCTSEEARVTIDVDNVTTPTISSSSSKFSICNGETINLSASCGASQIIRWSTGSTATSIAVNPTQATDYWVRCESASCTSSNITKTILVNTKPEITGSSLVCNTITVNSNNDANLAILQTITGILIETKSISNGSAVSFTVASGGSYRVLVQNDITGCTSEPNNHSFGSTAPSLVFGDLTTATKTVCNGSTLSINLVSSSACSAGFNLVWADNSPVSLPLTITFSETASTSKTYRVKCIRTQGGCTEETLSNILTVNVDFVNSPTVSPAAICSGATVSLGGSCSTASSSIKWYSNAAATTEIAATVQPTVTTTYYAVCQKSTCRSTIVQKTVTVNSIPTVTANCTSCVVATTTSECTASDGFPKVGGSINLTSSCSSGTVLWTGPGINDANKTLANPIISNVTLSMSGAYQVTCTSSAGCSATATKNVVVYSLCDLTFSNLPTPNPVASVCAIGFSKITSKVCNYNPSNTLQYSIERKNFNNTYVTYYNFVATVPNANGYFDTPNLEPGTYRINIREVPSPENLNQTICTASPSSDIVITCPCTAQGLISYDRWEGISGTSVLSLINSPNYLQTPTYSTLLTNGFEAPSNIHDNFGSRIRGYICPPATGIYTFFIEGDDNVELYLSTGTNPADKSKIAFGNDWTGPRQYFVYGSQRSVGINLVQNQKYYIEAFHKEGAGGDNISVAWRKPTDTSDPVEPIPAQFLSPYQACGLLVTSNLSGNLLPVNGTAMLTASGGDVPSPQYEWYQNNILVGQGNSLVVSPSVATTYVLKCTNCMSCSDSQITISVDEANCYSIMPNNNGKTLYVQSDISGALILQRTFSGASEEIWKREVQPDGSYKIKSVKNGNYIASSDGNFDVKAYSFGSVFYENWRFESTNVDEYRIFRANTNYGFDISGASTNDGAQLYLYNNTAQVFKFTSVTCPIPPPPTCVMEEKVYYHRWYDLTGEEISNFIDGNGSIVNATTSTLTEAADYAQLINNSVLDFSTNCTNPTTVSLCENFVGKVNGLICPPNLGNSNPTVFTFFLKADNSAKFFLSTDASPSTKTQRISIPATQSGSELSVNVTLTPGQKYYFEIWHKQSAGESKIALSWQAAGFSKSLVNTRYLSPVDPCGFLLTKNPNMVTPPASIPTLMVDEAMQVLAKPESILAVYKHGSYKLTSIDAGAVIYPTNTASGSGSNELGMSAAPLLVDNYQSFIIPNAAAVGTKTFKVSYSDRPACYKTFKVNILPSCTACLTCGTSGDALSTILYPAKATGVVTAKNFHVETSYLHESGNEYTQSITYLDGIGRPLQKISVGTAGTGSDFVSHLDYDSYGREIKKYLPYVASTNGAFQSNAIAASTGFFASLKNDPNSFSETQFETSPLQRIIKQSSPGDGWQLSGGNTKRFKYRTNIAGEIYYLNYNFSTQKVDFNNSTYSVGRLYVTEATDENNNVSIEYVDFSGKLICKKTGLINNGSGLLTGTARSTYYAYDDFGLLRAVFSPEATKLHLIGSSGSIDPFNTTTSELVFGYKYDARQRLIKRKVPDTAEENFAYDDLDRQISHTKAKSSGGTEVITTIYDGLNRVLETKLDGTLLTKNFYDNYTWQASEGAANLSYSADIYPSNYTLVKGMQTGTKQRVGEGVSAIYTYTTTYINYRGQTIQTKSKNQRGGIDINSVKIDFASKVTYTKSTLGLSTPLTNEQYLGFDEGGRTKSICQRIGGNVVGTYWEPVARYNYNAVGEMIKKTLGCDLQRVDYAYNVKGWIKKINDVDNLTTDKDFFAMRVSYAQDEAPQAGFVPQYNGNIARQEWNYSQRKGKHIDPVLVTSEIKTNNIYSYDPLDRLLASDMFRGASQVFKLHGLTYDDNGNIKTMQRSWKAATDGSTLSLVDNLTYTYQPKSNRLLKIDDAAAHTNGTQDEFFKDVAGNDYSYDALGNMKADGNKNISNVAYNHLNLPTQIANSAYTYTAGGAKTKMVVNGTQTYDYYGGAVLLNNAIEFVPTAEGRVLPPLTVKQNNSSPYVAGNDTTNKFWRYEYQLKDHLGNLRIACRCAEQAVETKPQHTYPAMVVQQATYDPWGVKLAMSVRADGFNGNPTDRYRYNGKEYQKDHGMYEYGFRWYDAAAARFIQVDPLAEKYVSLSPFSYVANNPSNSIDPDGRKIILIINKDGKDLQYEYNKGELYINNKRYNPTKESISKEMYRVLAVFRKIEKSDSKDLKNILKHLEESKIKHYVYFNNKNDNSVYGEYWNGLKYTQTSFDLNSKDSDPHPDYKGIGQTDMTTIVHEMRHMYDHDIGNMEDDQKGNNHNDPTEIRAVFLENLARAISGLKKRTKYGQEIDAKSLISPPNNIMPEK